MKLTIFLIIIGVLLLLFTFSVCRAASKESRYEEMRQRNLYNKSEPTDENS